MAKLTTLKPRLATQKSQLTIQQPGSWRGDKSSTQRGYGYKWQQARLQHLREHPLCVYCERLGRVTAASVVDHKTPHRGDMTLFWDRANWQSLCKPCHDSVKKQEEAELQ
ncbi:MULTISPECIES: HNH endonuclease [Pseudomonas]|uniref:HNH endonuclease n=1 Tax=Pseudomonas TaxID=286 RepID=UPI00259948EF|nr:MULTISPECIES: HNH endonuclease signature motif containing protein [Pseudomonas]